MRFSKVESSMLRQRNGFMPPLPKSLKEFGELLEDPRYSQRFACGTNGKPFYRMSRTGSTLEGTVIIFMGEALQEIMTSSEYFHMDGHFKMTPNVNDVYQLFTIMPVSFDHVFPAVSVLMSRKTKAAYKMLFRCLKELIPGLDFQNVMSDFERGLLKALREEFPNSILTGCLFHIDQAMWKKMAKLGLRNLLQENEDAAFIVRLCMALPFLPACRIREGFKSIQDFAQSKGCYNNMKAFLDYVQKTWLDGVGPEHISVYRHHRRTNNDLESYHRTLVDMLGKPHPNTWNWMDGMRKLQIHYKNKLTTVAAGYNFTRSRKLKYRLLDDQIMSLTQKLPRMSVLEFLKAASYHCKKTYNQTFQAEEDTDTLESDDVMAPPPAANGMVALPDAGETEDDSSEEPVIDNGASGTGIGAALRVDATRPTRGGTQCPRSPATATAESGAANPTQTEATADPGHNLLVTPARTVLTRRAAPRAAPRRRILPPHQAVGQQVHNQERRRSDRRVTRAQARAQARDDVLRARRGDGFDVDQIVEQMNNDLLQQPPPVDPLGMDTDTSVLDAVPINDPTQVSAAEWEYLNEIQRTDIDDLAAPDNWRFTKWPADRMTQEDVLVQAFELQQNFKKDESLLKAAQGDEEVCCICRDMKPTRMNMPCKHTTFCESCISEIVKKVTSDATGRKLPKSCSFCRSVVGCFFKLQ